MSQQRIEIITFGVSPKSIPGWLRKYNLLFLVGEFVPGWGGPEPKGWHVVYAATQHQGSELDSPGMTIWFLSRTPEDRDLFSCERWSQAADYIFQRLGRKSHSPTTGYTSYLFPSAPPGAN